MTFALKKLVEYARMKQETGEDDKLWVTHAEMKTLLAGKATVADYRPAKKYLEVRIESLRFIHVCSEDCPEEIQVSKK